MITTDLHGLFGLITHSRVSAPNLGVPSLNITRKHQKTQGTFYLSLFLKKIYNHRGVGDGTVAHVIEKVVGGNVHFSSCP